MFNDTSSWSGEEVVKKGSADANTPLSFAAVHWLGITNPLLILVGLQNPPERTSDCQPIRTKC